MSPDAFAGLDSWLERPYLDEADESERYVMWCEDNDFDPDEPDASEAYAAWLDEALDYDYDVYEDEE